MKRINLSIIIFITIALAGCYRSQSVRAPEYEIYVFAENSDFKVLEESLQSVFYRETKTPQPEIRFKIVHVDPEEFDQFLFKNQLLFVAGLKSEGSIADLVKRSVDQSLIRDKIERGDNFLFQKRDQWTEDQLVVTLVAPTLDDLVRKININRSFIYNFLYEFQQETVHNYVYRRLENMDIPKELLEKYQWQFRVPHDYFINTEDQENNYVFLRRRFPERWIFVKWFENVDPNIITPQWYYDLRDTIGVRYYGGERLNRQHVSTKEIEFLGRWCLRIEGLWEHEERVAGGPFFAYVFYDEGTERVYVIDCATFAPNREKIPYLDQLNVIANTFKTLVEIQSEETE